MNLFCLTLLSTVLAVQVPDLSLREKVGMMFFIRPEALVDTLSAEQVKQAAGNPSVALSEAMASTYRHYPAGGFCLFAHNLVAPEQLHRFISALHSLPGHPLICIDEELGRVSRLAGNPAFGQKKSISAGEMAQKSRPAPFSAYRTIGQYLRNYDVDIDFAPVADVNTNPSNIVIGDRAFGNEPRIAGKMVAESVRGLTDADIFSCLKHFPGHGDTNNDTHLGAAVTSKTEKEMMRCEMIPFAKGIRAGAAIVMVAHISAPQITGDDRPATLSYEIIEGLLRGKLGFKGVVITDAMEMGAITGHYDAGGAAVAAILAGVDIVLMPYGYREAFDAVLKAVEDGIIPLSRIEKSVRRIQRLHLPK